MKNVQVHSLKVSFTAACGIHERDSVNVKFFFFFIRLGLAASLHQRVIAQMKIKQEHDERKRAEMNPMHNGNVTITPTSHIKTEGKYTLLKLDQIY